MEVGVNNKKQMREEIFQQTFTKEIIAKCLELRICVLLMNQDHSIFQHQVH